MAYLFGPDNARFQGWQAHASIVTDPLDREAIRNAALEDYMKRLRNGLSGLLEFDRESVDQAITDVGLSFRTPKSKPAQPSDSQAQDPDAALIDWLDNNAKKYNFGFHIGVAPVGNISIQTVGNLRTDFRSAVKSAMRAQEKS